MRFSRDSYCHENYERAMKDASPLATRAVHGVGSEQHASFNGDSFRKLRVSQLVDDEIVQVLTPPRQRPSCIFFCRRSSQVNVAVSRGVPSK